MFSQIEGEVGVFKKGYALPDLCEASQQEGVDLTKPLVDEHHSVLVTGGARGVTWSFVETLAKVQKSGKIVIWGRTSLTDPGFDQSLASLETQTQIIEALGASYEQGSKLSPSELKQKANQVLKVREINENLAALKTLGVDVLYQSVDVSQESEILAALVDLEEKGHKIGAVIHGAGVLKDRLMHDLSEDDFIEVVDTKIRLLPHLERPIFDDLTCAVFFSSSTGRFGRKGQLAYAVANEVLNKFTQYYRLKKPEAKVLSINWGPWDGGMVDKSLKAVFDAEGIVSIPLDMGAQFLWQEVSTKPGFSGEVVVLAEYGQASAEVEKPESGSICLSLASFPILRHHRIKHHYVLPVVLHLELMIKKAMEENPSLHFAGVYDFRVLRGIKLGETDELQVKVELEGVKAVDNGLRVTASVCAYDTAVKAWYKSSSAEILIVEDPLKAPSPSIDDSFESYSMDVADLYKNFLFHGKRLQGIEAIDAYTKDQGISGFVQTQQRPGMWMQEPQLDTWYTNPLAIDSSFQLGVVWSSLALSLRSLPIGLNAYQQFTDFTKEQHYRVSLRVNKQKEQSFEADIEWYDEKGQVVALMKGYQAIMDESLKDSFKPASREAAFDSQV
jgi:NAD(P)-dependent dehydrogenase (short-subunit alcohol dehydrogenase family)